MILRNNKLQMLNYKFNFYYIFLLITEILDFIKISINYIKYFLNLK